MNCPQCNSVALTVQERHGVEIDLCPQCRGVWLNRGELDKIIERASQVEASYRRDDDRDDFDDDAIEEDRRRRSAGPAPYPGPGHGEPHYPQKRKSFWSEMFD